MALLKNLTMIRHKQTEIRDFCIQTIRFKKLLENATTLLDLFEDGNEKLKGEYILDRHYVVSLIDDVIEKLSMVVFDACTLSPENGPELYAQYDTHKFKAGELIRINSVGFGKNSPAVEHSDKTTDLEPEYQFLSDVLTWLDGKKTDMTVMNLIKKALVTGISGISAMETLKNADIFKSNEFKESDGNIYIVDLWKDSIAPLKTTRSIADIQSRPLKLFFSDVLKLGLSENINSTSWIAATTEHEISLNSLSSDVVFRLDVSLTGHEDIDYIFLFANNVLDTKAILPSGFHMEKTAFGSLAWKRNISAAAVEDNLITIGRNLFCRSTG